MSCCLVLMIAAAMVFGAVAMVVIGTIITHRKNRPSSYAGRTEFRRDS